MTQQNDKTVGAALVLGGGIAGMQASLDLANAGYYVHLVERQPAIGGTMAQLDKTFPTLDCSICILGPKLVEVAAHPNIELLTLAEVEMDVDLSHIAPIRISIKDYIERMLDALDRAEEATFVELTRDCQNDLISRHENMI